MMDKYREGDRKKQVRSVRKGLMERGRGVGREWGEMEIGRWRGEGCEERGRKEEGRRE